MNRYAYRDLIRKLREWDSRFYVDEGGGKGSHRLLCHPDIDGVLVTYALPYHGGKHPIAPHMLRHIVEKFHLPPDLL